MWENAVSSQYPAAAQAPAVRAGGGAEAAKPQAPAPAEEADRDTWTPGSAEEPPKTLFELMEESRKRAEEVRSRFKIKPRTNYGSIPMEAYAKLCRARNVAEVNAAAGYARRRISQLKSALRQDGESADQIRAAIGQLQKAALRAGRKKSDLNREKLTAERREHAAAERQRREALRAQSELRRKQSMRSVREQAYLQEAAASGRFASQMAMARAAYQLPGGTETAAAPAAAPAAPEVSGFTAEA